MWTWPSHLKGKIDKKRISNYSIIFVTFYILHLNENKNKKIEYSKCTLELLIDLCTHPALAIHYSVYVKPTFRAHLSIHTYHTSYYKQSVSSRRKVFHSLTFLLLFFLSLNWCLGSVASTSCPDGPRGFVLRVLHLCNTIALLFHHFSCRWTCRNRTIVHLAFVEAQNIVGLLLNRIRVHTKPPSPIKMNFLWEGATWHILNHISWSSIIRSK